MMIIDAELEKKEIINRYRRLLRKAKPILNDGDAKLIKKAFTISLEAHKDMRRKSGEPFIFHPLAVAEICVEEIGLGTTAIIAALMHDVVEDTDIELADIERMFGKKITRIIDGLTKIRGVFRVWHFPASRKFPENAVYPFGGRQGNTHKAGGPAPQHAHAGQHAPQQAAEGCQ